MTTPVPSAPTLREKAPAKINLTLRVLGRRDDGYHVLDSLVAFAAVSDEVALTPGAGLSLALRGPEAAGAGALADNLVLRAAHALADRVPGLGLGHFGLLKRIPAAAGLGGGSSDAAAALRLLARANRLAADDPRLIAAARATGSDVPVCLDPRPRVMAGAGEKLSAPLALPRLPTVLVNPRVATSTAAVFAALGLTPGETSGTRAEGWAEGWAGGMARLAFIAALAGSGNDLDASAMAVTPAIGEAVGRMARLDGCRLARMSGSGATVFGLFDTCRAAAGAARALRGMRPGWWVRTTMIG